MGTAMGQRQGTSAMRKNAAGIVQRETEIAFANFGCCAGQNNVIVQTDGTVASMFSHALRLADWGQHRSVLIYSRAADQDGEDLPKTLLRQAEPQPCLLRQRRARHQVDVGEPEAQGRCSQF